MTQNSGDYYKTIGSFYGEHQQPISPLVKCPRCKGDLKEIHNLKEDGTRAKNDKILDLRCDPCDFFISEIQQPKQSRQKA